VVPLGPLPSSLASLVPLAPLLIEAWLLTELFAPRRSKSARRMVFWRRNDYVAECEGRSELLGPSATEDHLLNRTDRPSPMPGEAEVKYLDGDFRVVRPGAFVRCAVTGVAIPLEELRYWSVDLQEAYASPEAVLQRHAAAYARKA
jgi:hypothetical protein